MPGSSAKGLTHLPAELFPADHIPPSVLNNLPIADFVSTPQAPSGPADAPGLTHLPVELFPVDHFPEVAVDYLPIGDLFGL